MSKAARVSAIAIGPVLNDSLLTAAVVQDPERSDTTALTAVAKGGEGK